MGKIILRMRVVKDTDEPCDLKAALLRGILQYVDGLFFGIIAYLSMNSSALNQRIGDKRHQTIVINARELMIKEHRAWWWFLLAALLYLTLDTIILTLLFVAGLNR